MAMKKLGDAIGDLGWLTKEPDTPKPEPKQCSGLDGNGNQCPERLNAFAAFGRWVQPAVCERCRDGQFKEGQRAQLLTEALAKSNIPPDVDRNVELHPDIAQFLGACGQEFLFVYGNLKTIRRQMQSAVLKYVLDRTSALSKSSAWYDTEYLMWERLRPDGNRNIQDYIRPRFLAVDNFADFAPTDWVNRTLFTILEERRRLRRKTIIASRHTMTEIGNYPWGEKTEKGPGGYDPAILRSIYDWAGGDSARANKTLNFVRIS